MIKSEDLKGLEKALGIPEGELDKLIKDPEEKPLPVAVDSFEIIPKADYATRIDNIGKAKYDEGKTAGTEITTKAIKNGFGLDVAKTIAVDELVGAIKSKVVAEAKLPVDEKVRELTADNTTLKTQKAELETKLTGIETSYKQKEDSRKIATTVVGSLPKFGNNAGDLMIPSEDAADLVLKRAEAKGIKPAFNESGEVVWKQGDNVMKDQNLVAQKADVVLKEFYQPYIRQAAGGGGGVDDPKQVKKGGMAAFNKEMDDSGVINMQQRNAEMQKRIKDKTLDPNIA